MCTHKRAAQIRPAQKNKLSLRENQMSSLLKKGEKPRKASLLKRNLLTYKQLTKQVGKANLMRTLEPNILVELKSGRYPLVDTTGIQFLEVGVGKKGLLLEKLGHSNKGVEAWHVLFEGSVILVWDDHLGGRAR